MCCSCMACSSADWVRGLARLISSAIRSCANTGPEMKRNDRLPVLLSSKTSAPRVSDGSRAGVNWKRVAAGQDRHQGVFNHPLLAEDDGGDRILFRADLTGDLLGGADDHVLEFFNTVCAGHFVLLEDALRFDTLFGPLLPETRTNPRRHA